MGYRLNRLDEPEFMAVSKTLLTEFGIHHRLESCVLIFWLILTFEFRLILILLDNVSWDQLRGRPFNAIKSN